MARYVYECLQFNQQTGECAQAGFVPRTEIPSLSTAEVTGILSMVAVCFAVAWAYKQIGRTIRN
jgi:hypothetical protein